MTQHHGFFDANSGDLAAFKVLIDRQLTQAEVPLADEIAQNVPLYRVGDLTDPIRRTAVLSEWGSVLGRSAGVLVLKGALPDPAVIDQATEVYNQIIADERAGASGKGDHFAASGANDRIWNAAQKHCLRDPENYARYMGSPSVAAVCEAWLGPNYQVTTQINQVRPGGQAQSAHRDYHLGFQTAEAAARYPVHAHLVTATLTLQGAVAHCDMPVESGPTKLLPFSQLYEPGYVAFHDPSHAEVFEARCIQLPLEKGDAVFFNPALFHAAGENRSADIHRMANLFQVSSAFGRAMESLDRLAMSKALFPVLRDAGLSVAERDAAIAATAEGYPFPTNLDTDPPVGGLAPESQAELMRRALDAGWSEAEFAEALDAQARRRLP
ncbi:phytanoyl-CoA dioxygenase family protein [Palleronia caenipelagi]|uniref:Phytanoyl-CoA dioxygenase n=1 Tax=Palleronia caenipelagi TaxID=2489174 RepID=A0A547Q6I2_9RHOB|nr:phytanoyl-CoA dioxygenase family protein [Palleronia caenipelagi]TRD21997.1 phytanoyl-CoA dioxygenase [Palleronia caenipelagi]